MLYKRLLHYFYNLCQCKSSADNIDNLEEPLLKFCESEESNMILNSLHTIHEYGEEHV